MSDLERRVEALEKSVGLLLYPDPPAGTNSINTPPEPSADAMCRARRIVEDVRISFYPSTPGRAAEIIARAIDEAVAVERKRWGRAPLGAAGWLEAVESVESDCRALRAKLAEAESALARSERRLGDAEDRWEVADKDRAKLMADLERRTSEWNGICAAYSKERDKTAALEKANKLRNERNKDRFFREVELQAKLAEAEASLKRYRQLDREFESATQAKLDRLVAAAEALPRWVGGGAEVPGCATHSVTSEMVADLRAALDEARA